MQKKLIALAIAGLSGAAFAQSNVTIYGAMDATYDNVKATGATTANNNLPSRGRTTMNSAFIGVKGAEDLGGGLKAVWQIEQAVGENNGGFNTQGATTYGLATRDTFMGLAGGWGTLVAGTVSGPTRVVGCKMDVNNSCTGIGANTALLGKLGGGSGAGYFDQRIGNAIAYISPTWSGFHFAVGYVPNENRGKDLDPESGAMNTSAWTAGAIYDQGPLFAALTWTQAKDKNATDTNGAFAVLVPANGGNTNVQKATNTRAAVKYDFGMGTVGLLWDRTDGDTSVSSLEAKQTVWYLPVTFKVGGAGKVIAQYGRAKNITGSFMDGANSNKDFGAKHWTVGYEHALSKRTIAKVLWSQVTNKDNGTYDYLYGVSPAASNTTAFRNDLSAGADPRGLSIGIRHAF